MHNESNLEMLVSKGENQTLEFKKSLSLIREALEGLCAMVNSDTGHGYVIFGIEPDGSPCGIEPGNLDKAQRSIIQQIEQKFDPPLIVQIELRELKSKQIMILSAKRASNISYHEYDGRAWIRQGASKRQLTIAEKDQLRRIRDRDSYPGPWQCDRCRSWVGVLYGFEITDKGMKKSYKCGCGGEFWPA